MALQHHKARSRENFPVASWLLPARARAVILAFYDFARGADDIADHEAMLPADKYRALQALDAALKTHETGAIPTWAHEYIDKVKHGKTPAEYGTQLLRAFVQDTHAARYDSLQSLLDYCALSAVPVGRVVRHACGDIAPSNGSDALCVVLQLLNHLQDLRSDYVELHRVYLPQEWMKAAGAKDAMLDQSVSAPQVRIVINQLLDYCEDRLMQAKSCHHDQSAWRVKLEIAIIWQIAWALCHALRIRDPLAQRVTLSRRDYAVCVVRAIKAVL